MGNSVNSGAFRFLAFPRKAINKDVLTFTESFHSTNSKVCRGAKSHSSKVLAWALFVIYALSMYRTRAIITRGLYTTFYPIFKGQKRFLRSFFFVKFCSYVWLVMEQFKIKSGL